MFLCYPVVRVLASMLRGGSGTVPGLLAGFVDAYPGPRRRRADAEMALCYQPAAWVI